MAKAATRLAISQPVISRAVADAEYALGVPLFDRNAQGVNPTQYGHALLKRGIAPFDEIDQGSRISSFSPIPQQVSCGLGPRQAFPRGLVLPSSIS